jgi:hypothetical protein
MDMSEISQLELDLLLLFYTYSDQFGDVDMPLVCKFAKERMGVFIPLKQFTFLQEHVDILMERGMIPDTRGYLIDMKLDQPKPKLKAKRTRKPKDPTD